MIQYNIQSIEIDPDNWVLNTGIDIYKTTAIESQIPEMNCKIYPNPTNGIFTIEIGNTGNKAISIEIQNINGKLVCQKITENKDAFILEKINTEYLSQGIYVVKIGSEKSLLVEKIIIE